VSFLSLSSKEKLADQEPEKASIASIEIPLEINLLTHLNKTA
jgi:hypothetical protein